MNYPDIIYSPVITEKSMEASKNNVYTFKVAKKAEKPAIKEAIEKAFNVKVESINTLNTKPKAKRVGRHSGMTKTYKKAIVTLKQGFTIEL